jgi:hypothetical protein
MALKSILFASLALCVFARKKGRLTTENAISMPVVDAAWMIQLPMKRP